MADNNNEVSIGIKSSSEDAAADLNKLTEAVEELNSVMKDFGLSVSSVKSVSKALSELSNIDLTNLDRILDNIPNALSKMQKMMDSINTSKLTESLNAIEQVSKKFGKISSNFMENSNIGNVSFDMSGITDMARELSGIDANQFSSVSLGMRRVSEAMNTINKMNISEEVQNSIRTKLNSISAAFREFIESMQGYNLRSISSMLNAIKNLPKTMESLKSIDMENAKVQFQTMSEIIRSFIATLKEGSGELQSLSNILNKIGKARSLSGISNVGKQVDQLGKKADKTSKKLSNMLSAGKIYAIYNQLKHFSQGFLNMINQSIDFNEIENYFSRAMGNMREEAMKFQESLSEMFGTSLPDMMQAQATFKNMLGSLGGLSDEMSYMLSERVTKMTLDYASLYNTTIESAATKFQAALSKQVRPIRSQSGYDITQAVLGQSLENIGIYDRSIKQLSELEKRLMIIITLQQQMGRSAAMGDFSRTIEETANQIKVFQQQVSELGRAISSVFYGVISFVMPYINGFIMTVKTLVQMFASFIGYEIPDSSGATDNILDSMTDGMDDFGESIGSANTGLDDTSKKIKEIEGQLASFDKLNVISPPSDTSSSTPSGGGAGLGGSIDPRILKALQDYDYLFGSVRMKANDIRDRLLEWASILGAAINENIFQPIMNSWEKYGEPIIANFSSGFENIGELVASILEETDFKDWVQSISDLFFSLLDTASLVFDGITEFILDVWNSGGKHLYNSLSNLTRSVVDLATAINDKFVKPLIKAFQSRLQPIISTVFGGLLDILGYVIDAFSGLIDWIAKTDAVLIPLTSTVVGFFGAWKIAKLVSEFSKLRGYLSFFDSLKYYLSDHIPLLGNFFKLFETGVGKIRSFKDAYAVLNSALFSTKAWDTIANKLLGFGDNLLKAASKTTGLASGLKSVLGNALNWVALNPLPSLAIALGTVVGGLLLFNNTQEESKYEMEDYSEHIQQNIKDLQEFQETMSNAKAEAESRYNESLAEITLVEKYIDKLKEMTNSDGYVENINQAQLYIDEINSKMPETVQLTEDYRVAWSKTDDEIYNSIEALKEKAKWEAYSKLYTDALYAQLEAERQRSQAISELTEKQKRLNEILDEFAQGNTKNSEEYYQLKADIDGLKTTIDESNVVIEEATNNMSFYDEKIAATSNTTKTATSEMSESYKMLSDSHKESFDKQANTLLGAISARNDYLNSTKEINEEEVLDTQNAVNAQIEEFARKSSALGLTYDDMLNTIRQYGIDLSEEEQKQLKESYDKYAQNREDLLELLNQYGIDVNDEEYQQYLDRLENAEKSGADSGATFIENLATELGDGKKDTNKETNGIMEDIKKIVNGFNIQAKIGAYADTDAISRVKQTITALLGGVQIPIVSEIFGKGMFGFATGGFPNTAEMFYARENGIPELVGRVGRKTTVANNDQVVDVILNAMENRGLLGSGGYPKLELNIPLSINKREIAKLQKEIDLEEYLKTGKKK